MPHQQQQQHALLGLLLLLLLSQASAAGLLLSRNTVMPTYADVARTSTPKQQQPSNSTAAPPAWPADLDCTTHTTAGQQLELTNLCAAHQQQQQQQQHQQQRRSVGPAVNRAGAANPLRFQKPYLVCVSPWVPMVHCDPDTDPATWKGYQVELFRMLAKEVGWEDGDWVFSCMDYSTLMDDLNDPAGNCTLSASGIEVSPENLAAGLQFTWPTYKSGLRVMIHTHLQTGSTWAFASIFAWEVWILLLATTIAVGLVTAGLEWANETYRRAGEWQSWEWYSLSKIAHVVPHVGDPGSDASRVLILGYGFLVLVMMSMYTAMAASRLTAAALVHPVHSEHDLADPSPYKTQTWSEYVTKLESHQHIHAYGKPWDNAADLDKMVASLRDGTYTALVLDTPVLEYVTSQNAECDLFLVGNTFETFSVALAFPPAANASTVYDFSRGIVQLQTYQGALDMLESVYIKTGGTDKCFGSDSGGHGSGEMIELYQVSGLWYILCITVGICFLLTLVRNLTSNKGSSSKLETLKRLGSALGHWSAAGGDNAHGYGSSMPGHLSSDPGGGWLQGHSMPDPVGPQAAAGRNATAGTAHPEATAAAAAAAASAGAGAAAGRRTAEMRDMWGPVAATSPALDRLFEPRAAPPQAAAAQAREGAGAETPPGGLDVAWPQ